VTHRRYKKAICARKPLRGSYKEDKADTNTIQQTKLAVFIHALLNWTATATFSAVILTRKSTSLKGLRCFTTCLPISNARDAAHRGAWRLQVEIENK